MDVRVYKPIDPRLKEVIHSYYFLSQREGEEMSYRTFPKSYGILTISKDVEFRHGEDSINIEKKVGAPLVSDLVLAYKKPLVIHYSGGVEELTIYFKPLGIYSLLKNKSLSLPNKSGFIPDFDYAENMLRFFEIEDKKVAIQFIEKYLTSKLSRFSHPFMFDFIEELSNDLNMSISDFCERKRIAPKTLYRHSKKYLCRTPSEFRKVLRFNAVLKDYIDFNVVQPVTNVDSFIHFFDQAHMIKDFKSLTGLTPKLFFEKLNSPSEELNWIFLKDR